jgi:hypothetical protein
MSTHRQLRLTKILTLIGLWLLGVWVMIPLFPSSAGNAQEIRILQQKPDPYGYPRPAPGERNAPVATSFFLQLGFNDKDANDTVLSDSIVVRLGPRDEPPVEILQSGGQFTEGYSGKVYQGKGQGPTTAVYIDSKIDLKPSTTYVVSVSARSKNGASLNDKRGTWEFTTESPASTHSLKFQLDLSSPFIHWHGGFFTGFCKPSFCTSASNRIPGYELMDRLREQYPKAWSLQRDFTMTGMERQPKFLSGHPPNAVRERQTRRIVAMEKHDEGILLSVEDFFGHEQYGIASDRPLSEDYHPGNEVLIADGVNDATAKVLAVVEDRPGTKSLLVTSFQTPGDGWKTDYSGPLPTEENPDAPGLFPRGGCYLTKLRPSGTPHYYWGRLDKEWDIACRRFGRRLVVNFAEAPGDLSIDGRDWTFAKDYAEYHEVVRDYTEHVIERYGDACLDYYWSVFNEPDLATLFWRSGDWNELQKFYDYTVDAMLRAFEDHGYDSNRVMVGGLEIAAIFGANIRRPILEIFLNHCSPTATCKGALLYNAAFADNRLNGKRSRRVEEFCRQHNGQGSPCDFVSIHSYNASRITAAKLIRAKEIALDVDPAYYADLWVNSFESCPGWSPPPDVAAEDSYLGNGYFPTWCADVVRRQLQKANENKQYAFGETILTFWPWPNSNFRGHNASTRVISVDEDEDGTVDRHETIAMPILNFLALVSAMGEDYRVLPERSFGGHVVSGFVSKGTDAVRVLLYSHNERDIQSRSKASFEITLDLDALPWPKVRCKEYRFDKDHNSYYRLGLQWRDRPAGGRHLHRPGPDDIQRVIVNLQSNDEATQIAALKEATTFSEIPGEIISAAIKLYEKTSHPDVRAAIEEATRHVQSRQTCYSPEEIRSVQELSALHVTNESILAVGKDNKLRLEVAIEANGANVIVIEPATNP